MANFKKFYQLWFCFCSVSFFHLLLKFFIFSMTSVIILVLKSRQYTCLSHWWWMEVSRVTRRFFFSRVDTLAKHFVGWLLMCVFFSFCKIIFLFCWFFLIIKSSDFRSRISIEILNCSNYASRVYMYYGDFCFPFEWELHL